MVWSNAGSTLYKAVEQHNSTTECETHPPHSEQQAPPPQEHKQAANSTLPCKQHTCPKCTCHETSSGFDNVLKDKDFLLIAGLMLLLMHEKADSKLILALAFVLFG